MSVITPGTPHQPRDLLRRSCLESGLVARPRPRSGLCTTAHVAAVVLSAAVVAGIVVAAAAGGRMQMLHRLLCVAPPVSRSGPWVDMALYVCVSHASQYPSSTPSAVVRGP